MKTAAWWITGSVGLLSDALESFVNLASALFALAMVTIAARPADEDHPFGHTKAEYFSSAFEGLMIAAAAIAIVWSALQRFMNLQPLEGVGIGLALTVASSLLNGLLAHKMMAASRRHRSVALEADARHLYTDVWTSAGVVVGVALVQITGWLWLDPVVAIGVAANIIREGARVVWVSVDGLMDKARRAGSAGEHRPHPGALRRKLGPLRRHGDAARRQPALPRRPHACSGELDARPRRGAARRGRAGVDGRDRGAARVDPAPALERRAAIPGCPGIAVIALVQRVAEARVAIGDRVVGAIGRGALLFVCAEPDDSEAIADRLIAKVLGLRIFADAAGKMNLDLAAVGGGLLVVSQFTLAADTSRGHRPGFSGAAGAELGRRLYERALATARRLHGDVASGEFGADMQVSLVNDGPVTIPITLRA